jgi:2-polyprenyl-6-methoxyphenol hydroxylase-like FAD-dependent oxidoreductase
MRLGITIVGISLFCVATATAAPAPLKDHYDRVISGAGPGGVTAALASIRKGIPAHEILLIDKRLPADAKRKPSDPHPHGSRTRVVVLDSHSVDSLNENHVPLPGAPLRQMVAHFPDHAPSYFPARGTYKTVIEDAFGGRSLELMPELGELEHAGLARFIEAGGRVAYGIDAPLRRIGKSDDHYLSIDGVKVTGELITVAEGANSAKAAMFPKIEIASHNTSNYLSLDLPFSANAVVRPGDVLSIIYPKERVMVYGFAGLRSASLNMMLPHGVGQAELKRDPSLHRRYLTLLHNTARAFGLQSDFNVQGTTYSGQLSMRSRVGRGNVVLIGESLRGLDAIAGTGANAAMADGEAIGELGHPSDRGKLTQALADNTYRALEYSLYFRELAEYAFKSPGALSTAQRWGGMSARGSAGRSLTDLGMSLGSSLLGAVWGKEGMRAISRGVMDAVGAPKAPFQSQARQELIGVPHPESFAQP